MVGAVLEGRYYDWQTDTGYCWTSLRAAWLDRLC